MSTLGMWIINNHPYQYVFFSEFARGFAEENFTLDYWHVSKVDTLHEILRIDDRERITVAMHHGGGHVSLMLEPEKRERIILTSIRFAPDYIIMGSRIHINDRRRSIRGYERIFQITVDGFAINSLYRYLIQSAHFDNNVYRVILSIDSSNNQELVQNIIDSNMDTTWRTQEARKEGDYIVIGFSEPVSYNLVRLTAMNTNEFADSVQIMVSIDGINWDTSYIVFNNAVDNVFIPTVYRYMQIKNLQEHEVHAWSIRKIEFGNIEIDKFH